MDIITKEKEKRMKRTSVSNIRLLEYQFVGM
jgi:hypothetical protein